MSTKAVNQGTHGSLTSIQNTLRSNSRKQSSNSSGHTQQQMTLEEQQRAVNQQYGQFTSRNQLTRDNSSQGSSGAHLKKNPRQQNMPNKTQQQASLNESQIAAAVNKSAINNYMQTFHQKQQNIDREPLVVKKQLVKSPTNASRAAEDGRRGRDRITKQAQAMEPLSVIGKRNIQTADGGARTSFRSNLAQTTTQNPQPKFIKRQTQIMNNPVQTMKSTRTLSKNESSSPSHKLPTQTYTVASRILKEEQSDLMETLPADELNLTMVQAEEVQRVPRESYAYNAFQGVLTPEPQLATQQLTKLDTLQYSSPHQKLNKQQQQIMQQDKHQTYFTSDSNERLQGVQQARHQNGSFAMQGSPRASYYSPQRNQSQSKNLWLNDTIPVASPNRQTLTPSQLQMAVAQTGSSSSAKKDKKMAGGVTNLGTSYDFNKLKKFMLKKGLDQVNTRDLLQYENRETPQTQQQTQKNDQVKDLMTSAANRKVTTKDLAELMERDNQAKKHAEPDMVVIQKPPDVVKVVEKEQQQEEVIVFSDNHSMEDYVVGKQIGQGAYATVHIGIYRRYNKKVALKIYQKEKMKDLQRKKSVRREIKLMKRLDHPNIARLFDAVETDTQVILVMEYVGGGSTHGFLKSKPNRQMEENEARKIFSQLISALSYLHTKSIAHRDIKLENVMLDSRGNVKLIDFGFSTQIPNTQKIKLFCGTPSYMAPEIVKKIEFCGPPADIYATGVLLYAFFCGCFPYRGKDDKDLYKKIANDDLIIPNHVPLNARKLIALMLQKNPDSRPTSHQLFNDGWVQAGLVNNPVSSPRSAAHQTRSNSNSQRNEAISPNYTTTAGGQKIPIPLNDHRMTQQTNQPQRPRIIYDSQPKPMTQAMNKRQPYRNVIASQSSARSNNTGTGGRSSVRSPRDPHSPPNMMTFNRNNMGQQFQIGSDGNHSSGGTQRNGMNTTGNRWGVVDTSNTTINTTLSNKQESTDGALFVRTQPTANQLSYAKVPVKPSTPLNIGRYYAAASQRVKNNKLKVNTERAANVVGALNEHEGQQGPATCKAINTVRNARHGLVVDELPLQSNTSRGEPTNRILQPQQPAVANSYPTATAAAPLSPNSERFPNRKQSGPGGIFNSEAYKAYYTHSAAANNASATGATTSPTAAINLSVPNNFVTMTEQHAPGMIRGSGQQPLLDIAQEGPMNSSSTKSPQEANGHQTINNNINIINYITQVACSHPSHREENNCAGSNDLAPATTRQSPQKQVLSAAKTNNWTGNQASSDPPGGVYSPTGKTLPSNFSSNKAMAASMPISKQQS